MDSSINLARNKNGWGNGIAAWEQDDTTYISCTFSYLKPKAEKLADDLHKQGREVKLGGVAYRIWDGSVSALEHHNPFATYTSRGCPRKCPWCLVPIMFDKGLIEFEDWKPNRILCDDNILATSKVHFDSVIDKLLVSDISGFDFQGVDARFLLPYHVEGFAKLGKRLGALHLAWDRTDQEASTFKALNLLIDGGVKKDQLRVYVLIGFDDTPEDALYRLEKLKSFGVYPNPMRYQPIDTLKRNSFVGENWTHKELVRYMRYWANLRFFRKLDFKDYVYPYKEEK
jgi:hypothetical protein